jgi:hypothetical protein
VVEVEAIDDRDLDRAGWVVVWIVHSDSLSRSRRRSVRDCLGVSERVRRLQHFRTSSLAITRPVVVEKIFWFQ